ncbi:MAG: hypothetical protein RhofKO_26560 [Rhodothermales bacterium]
MRLFFALLVLLLLVPAPALIAQSQLTVHTRADGATYLYLPETPLPGEAFQVLRIAEGDTVQVTEQPIIGVASGAALRAALGTTADDRLREMGYADADIALRTFHADPVLGTLAAMLYPDVGRALGRLVVDADGTSGSSVTYQVHRVDDQGRRLSTIAEQTLPRSGQAPSAPQQLSAENDGLTVTLHWAYPQETGARTDGVIRFDVYRTDAAAEPVRLNRQPILRNRAESTFTFAFTDTPGAHTYTIAATDIAEQTAFAEPLAYILLDNVPPIAPSGVAALLMDNAIQTTWDVSTEPDAVGYHVYRSRRVDGGFERLTSAPLDVLDTVYRDDTVELGRTYFYRVTALDEAGNESTPSTAEMVIAEDRVAPPSVDGLTARWEANQARITWQYRAPADLLTYIVMQRRMGSTLPFAQRSLERHTSRQFTDAGPFDDGAWYEYLVFAADSSRNVSDTARVVLRVPDTTPPDAPRTLTAHTDAAQAILLHWTPTLAQDATTYTLYRDDAALATVPLAETTFRDTTPLAGSTYRYAVTATDSLGNESVPTTLDGSVRDAQPPAPIRNLVARTGNGGVQVQWEAALSTDVVGYRLERSDAPTSGFTPLHEGLLPEPQFTDATGARGQWYRVVAVDTSANESGAGRARQAR